VVAEGEYRIKERIFLRGVFINYKEGTNTNEDLKPQEIDG
jgi:hypothetical protein